jgi:Cu(I)/Ag(I) efflux system membrane fusion protein
MVLVLVWALSASLGLSSGPALAAGESAAAAQVHKGEGTVHHVNVPAGKVNMAHGPIKSLNWPAMTMDFRVKDKAVLAGLKPGQRVEFELEKSGGQYVITRITTAKK